MNGDVGLIKSINPKISSVSIKVCAEKTTLKYFLKGGSNMHYLISLHRSSQPYTFTRLSD